MDARYLISRVIEFLDKPKPVYVYIHHRGENGNVVKKERVSVSHVSSHSDEEVKIFVNAGQIEDVTDEL